MNITFTLTAKGFLQAAEIEEMLQNNEIEYSVDGKLNSKRTTVKKRRKTFSKRKARRVVTKADIKNIIKDSKTFEPPQLVGKYDMSRSTIDRILTGTHTLQTK